jgi:hypothetical protein
MRHTASGQKFENLDWGPKKGGQNRKTDRLLMTVFEGIFYDNNDHPAASWIIFS